MGQLLLDRRKVYRMLVGRQGERRVSLPREIARQMPCGLICLPGNLTIAGTVWAIVWSV